MCLVNTQVAITASATDYDSVPGTVLSVLHTLMLTLSFTPHSKGAVRLVLATVLFLGEETEAQGG